LVVTTGVPHAIASTSTSPKFSECVGRTNTSRPDKVKIFRSHDEAEEVNGVVRARLSRLGAELRFIGGVARAGNEQSRAKALRDEPGDGVDEKVNRPFSHAGD